MVHTYMLQRGGEGGEGRGEEGALSPLLDLLRPSKVSCLSQAFANVAKIVLKKQF
jgi:hypothetical protein